MLVWQSGGELKADTRRGGSFLRQDGQALHTTGGQAWVRRYERGVYATQEHGDWQLSRRARMALEYSMAIASALASSYLILRLGL